MFVCQANYIPWFLLKQLIIDQAFEFSLTFKIFNDFIFTLLSFLSVNKNFIYIKTFFFK